jgi:hypothetical protein
MGGGRAWGGVAPGRVWRRARRVGVACRGGIVAVATATLICAYRDRRSVIRRMAPRTNYESRWRVHRRVGDRSCGGERPGRPPAQAGRPGRPGRCDQDWGGGGARRAHRGVVLLVLAGHLGPDEPGQLAGDRGQGHARWLAAGGQGLVLAVRPPLCLPGAGQGARGGVALAAAQGDADRGLEPVRPRGPGQGGAGRPGPVLVTGPRRTRSPLEYSAGTSPVKPMNARAEGNRRQPATSAARVRPVSSAIPR